MARFIRWVAEPFTVFGIGALLNLILSAAAYAGVIGADRIDPDWIFLAGAAGGIVSALVHVGVVSLGSEPATSREIMRAVIEGVFAVVVGALVARFWAAPIALRLAPDINPSDLRAIGFGIGALLNLILSAAAYAGVIGADPVSYTHLTLPTNREV